ncbi:hypothetical protein IKN40_07485, partial [bacterium]|nr:hypothetical protein [bacterium]
DQIDIQRIIPFNIIAIFITIPITVIGISGQNFDKLQYFANKLLVTAITATILILLTRLLTHNQATVLI